MQVLPVKRGGEVYCPFVVRICIPLKLLAEVIEERRRGREKVTRERGD